MQEMCAAANFFAGGRCRLGKDSCIVVWLQVTPMLGLLSALRERALTAEFHAEGSDAGTLLPLKVVFVWVCRHAEEFDMIDEALLAEAR